MTEDEAKTKWCPFARASEGALAAGRLVDLKCIGSACMAFRWMVTPGTAARFATAKLENPRSEGPSENSGYCGLAGAPQ